MNILLFFFSLILSSTYSHTFSDGLNLSSCISEEIFFSNSFSGIYTSFKIYFLQSLFYSATCYSPQKLSSIIMIICPTIFYGPFHHFFLSMISAKPLLLHTAILKYLHLYRASFLFPHG